MTPFKPATAKLPPKPKQKETAIVQAILDALAWKFKGKGKFWRNNVGALKTEKGFMRFGSVGSSDILGVLAGGQMVCLEVKRPGGKATAHQVAWLAEMKALGALVGVVTSMEEAIEMLENATKGVCYAE